MTTKVSTLPDLIRAGKSEFVPFGCIGREQYVNWIAAIADLLTIVNHGELADRTPKDIAWLQLELTRVVQALDESARADVERAA